MESSAAIWEVLARTKREVITSLEIGELSRRLDRKPEHVARHLRREGYLLPLFKGYYRVRNPEEIRLGEERRNPLELFALAADAKGIGSWYFGLHTALRLNSMTHEDRREETVISDRFYRIRGVPIGPRRFVIHKWAPALLAFGLVEKGPYKYSDPEKTVLDLAYLDYWNRKKGRAETRTWNEHVDAADAGKLRRYLAHYPAEVKAAVGAVL
ncbi:MAG: type IV toxin-antitoxin system AbiEi family antitoxin domain-containing protein [Methanobacteriota archaeon]